MGGSDAEIDFYECDLGESQAVLDIIGKNGFDYIFHLAARTKAGDYTLYHKGDQWMNNQLINTNILCYWKEFQPQAKMVAFGTSCSYSPEYTNLIEENYSLNILY